jgi:hypothetical protein
MSVRLSARNYSDPTGFILIKFDIRVFFENLPRKWKFHQNRNGITATLLEDRYTFLILYLSFLPRMRIVSEISCREIQNTPLSFNIPPPPPEIRVVYGIMWKNVVGRDRQQMTVWRMRILCWIRKGTKVPSEYVIFLLFHRNSGCTNASQYYVIHTLRTLFHITSYAHAIELPCSTEFLEFLD